ncbi:MAG TPA: hypothetical protein VJP85_11875 [Candidatus Baltobacteraceae bacterium]|nr:hypothetical protein [Candidatus Baltobacteraceae bacterium]
MKYRISLVLSLLAVVVLAAAAPASARTIDHGITAFGSSVNVPEDEEVKGDVTVIGGEATIDGRIDGDLNVIGGTWSRGPNAVITGDINDLGGTSLATYVPFMPSASTASTMAHENHKLMMWLAYSVIVLLAFLLFPVRVRAALGRVEHHPGLSAGVGVLALVAVFPIMILLAISFIGWPLIPVEILAVFAAILIGHAAVSMLIGRRLYELILPRTTPSPIAALILGLIVVSAAGIVPVLGPLVMCLVWLVGLGAAILAFVRETAFMGPASATAAAPGGGPRPPIGGPPMRAS